MALINLSDSLFSNSYDIEIYLYLFFEKIIFLRKFKFKPK